MVCPGGKDHWAIEDSLGYLARQIFRSFSLLRERRTRAHGISAGQWSFLRELWRKDGVSQRSLSERLAMRDPTTAVTLRGLEYAGLIRREVNASDRRETLVFLTPRGRSLGKILLPVTAEVQSLAVRGLSDDEVATLRRLLNRVIENLVRKGRAADEHHPSDQRRQSCNCERAMRCCPATSQPDERRG